LKQALTLKHVALGIAAASFFAVFFRLRSRWQQKKYSG